MLAWFTLEAAQRWAEHGPCRSLIAPVSHLSNAIHMAEPAAHGLVALAPGATLEAMMRLDIAVI